MHSFPPDKTELMSSFLPPDHVVSTVEITGILVTPGEFPLDSYFYVSRRCLLLSHFASVLSPLVDYPEQHSATDHALSILPGAKILYK